MEKGWQIIGKEITEIQGHLKPFSHIPVVTFSAPGRVGPTLWETLLQEILGRRLVCWVQGFRVGVGPCFEDPFVVGTVTAVSSLRCEIPA